MDSFAQSPSKDKSNQDTWLGDATSSEILVLDTQLTFVIFYLGVCMYVHLWQERGGQVDDTCVRETFHS